MIWKAVVLATILLLSGCAETYVFFTLEPGIAWGVPCLGDLTKPNNTKEKQP